jgi:hypothetical protein
MKKRLLGALWLLFMAGLWTARGDGKVFSTPRAFPNVAVPDQRALIHYSNGTERLVIETSFAGSGTNFAWVIPVPSVPKIEPVTSGLFPTLQVLFSPTVIHAVPRYYLGVLLAGALLYLLLTVRPTGRMLSSDVGACLTAAASAGLVERLLLFGVLLGLFLLFATHQVRRGRKPELSVPVAFGIALLLAGLLLPALATAKAGAGADQAGVEVLERQTVGLFDTATLSAKEPKTLVQWLQTNGFVASSNVTPAVENYIREGWVFVAAKARRDRDTASPERLHPLAFTFATTNPVYPLRLTGVDNDSCSIELFVFGPGRAEVPGFQVDHCEAPLYPKESDQARLTREGLQVRHPQLRVLVDGAPAATKLTAHLRKPDMQSDAAIAWRPFQPYQTVVHSTRGAAIKAANLAVPLLVAGVLALGVARQRTGSSKQRWRLAGRCVCTLALVAGFAFFLSLPRIAVRSFRGSRIALHSQHLEAALDLRITLGSESGKLPSQGDRILEMARARLTTFWSTPGKRWRHNVFTGLPVHEEDSPGNYVLRDSPDGLEYVWFDADGAEHAERERDRSGP